MNNTITTKEQFKVLQGECTIAHQLVASLILAANQAHENLEELHDFDIEVYEQPQMAALDIAIQAAIEHRDNLVDQRIKARKILFPSHS